MSKNNRNDDDEIEVGYKKKVSRPISYNDPIHIKNNLKEEISKLYPDAKYNLSEDSDGTIYVNLDPDNEDFDLIFDGIEDLIESSFNDIDDYLILVREDPELNEE